MGRYLHFYLQRVHVWELTAEIFGLPIPDKMQVSSFAWGYLLYIYSKIANLPTIKSIHLYVLSFLFIWYRIVFIGYTLAIILDHFLWNHVSTDFKSMLLRFHI